MIQRSKLIQQIAHQFQLDGFIDQHKLERSPYILEECDYIDAETNIAQVMIYCLNQSKLKEEPFIFSQLIFHFNELSKCKNPDILHLNIFRNMEREKQTLVIQFLQYTSTYSSFIIDDDQLKINKIIERFKSQI